MYYLFAGNTEFGSDERGVHSFVRVFDTVEGTIKHAESDRIGILPSYNWAQVVIETDDGLKPIFEGHTYRTTMSREWTWMRRDDD